MRSSDPDGDLRPPAARPKTPKVYGYEMKSRQKLTAGIFLSHWNDWARGSTWYTTTKRRDQAVEALNKRNAFFVYRPFDR